ncbi:nitroreductase family protein, partial [Salipaludibacillus sp. CF4.18]|uniref:nitroreductase family protein n=1 Tax=Salipaludibacillus sp. CF4.18 TaxID=3373081 RepID=UPI003EE5BAAD
EKQWEEDFSATSALIQNFQLSAWENDLGVVWKTNRYNKKQEFLQAVGIKDDEKIVGVLHIGYINKIPEAKPRTRVEEKLTIVSHSS